MNKHVPKILYFIQNWYMLEPKGKEKPPCFVDVAAETVRLVMPKLHLGAIDMSRQFKCIEKEERIF